MQWVCAWKRGPERRRGTSTAGIIRIEDTKNREPRSFPFTVLPALADLIKRQRELTVATEQARGIIVRHVLAGRTNSILMERSLQVPSDRAAGPRTTLGIRRTKWKSHR